MLAEVSHKLSARFTAGASRRLPAVVLALLLALSVGGVRSAAAWDRADSEALVSRMEAAYRDLNDYQTRLVITGFGKDSAFTAPHRLLYTFKKPNRVRVDFESPHRGMTIAYPDQHGNVALRLVFPPITLRVDAESPLVEISPGQQINQTDLGMLIRNISHSLTDMFQGDLDVSEDSDRIVIRVLSDNPFKRGVPTRYTFTIDKRLHLPVGVDESSPSGVLKRRVLYENLRINTGIGETFFRLR
ncbi:MAG: hypothetical protein WAW37_16670 [Syntrophobacteraceae bacterium]